MSKESTIRDTWHPQSAHDRDMVMEELQAIVASPHFSNSKRYPALLQYVVENTLSGRTDRLKERTLGVEVFDRPATYDTNADTVVRYTAGEVRKRLLLYYSAHSPTANIRISLPAGSYVPEFLHGDHLVEGLGDRTHFSISHDTDAGLPHDSLMESDDHQPSQQLNGTDHIAPSLAAHQLLSVGPVKLTVVHMIWIVVALVALAGTLAELNWRHSSVRPRTAVDDFWEPVLKHQGPVLLCTGSVVFDQGRFSGVATAGKDIEYPFVSMQIVSAIAELSSLLERSGAASQLISSATAPLTDLRDHSIILLGGYNNQWTMRLLEPQRFQFSPEPVESIVDRTQPQVHWVRDRSLPYSSADDYALIARFRDSTTGGWVVVLAGLGRNGSEAAAHFVNSPEYVQLLKNSVGKYFSNGNIEAVLKVRVIDGKTGAPSIVAVYGW